ncbi:MAG: Uma2 family endonuclease [Blastocatellia bacterium]
MATAEAKLKAQMPESKAKKALHLPVRVPAEMQYNFFVTIDGYVTDQEFDRLVQLNSEMRLERTAEGLVEIMPPPKGDTGAKNSRITTQLTIWADENGTGIAFDSSSRFKLPNGATRSPDASWVERSKLAALSPKQKKEYFPFCPDFVIELRSLTDRLPRLKEKMAEYIANGARLAWLIDPIERKVYVYRPESEVEEFENPATVNADPILSGFTLHLAKIWEPDF